MTDTPRHWTDNHFLALCPFHLQPAPVRPSPHRGRQDLDSLGCALTPGKGGNLCDTPDAAPAVRRSLCAFFFKNWGRGWIRWYEAACRDLQKAEKLALRTVYSTFPADGVLCVCHSGMSVQATHWIKHLHVGLQLSLCGWPAIGGARAMNVRVLSGLEVLLRYSWACLFGLQLSTTRLATLAFGSGQRCKGRLCDAL